MDVLGHGGDSFHEGGLGWQSVTSFLYCMEGTTVGTASGQMVPVSPCFSPLSYPQKKGMEGCVPEGRTTMLMPGG